MDQSNYIAGDLLKAARTLAGQHQKQLIHELKVSATTLKSLERNGITIPTARPSAARLIRHFDVLGIRFSKYDGRVCGVYKRQPEVKAREEEGATFTTCRRRRLGCGNTGWLRAFPAKFSLWWRGGCNCSRSRRVRKSQKIEKRKNSLIRERAADCLAINGPDLAAYPNRITCVVPGLSFGDNPLPQQLSLQKIDLSLVHCRKQRDIFHIFTFFNYVTEANASL